MKAFCHIIDQDDRSLRERYRIEAGPSSDISSADDERGVWGRLRLHWKSLFVYFIFLIGPLLITKQYDLTVLVFLTLGFSIYSFGKGWGSMWCWIVNGMVVLGALKSAFAGVRSRTAERLP